MFSIGELSCRTGIKVPTIRYYEDVGLIPAPVRSEGGQRRYDQDGLKRLDFIKHARDLGLPLESIRALLALEDAPGKPCAGAHRIAGAHLADVRQRIARLRRLELELERIASVHDHGVTESCSVLEAFGDHHHCRHDH